MEVAETWCHERARANRSPRLTHRAQSPHPTRPRPPHRRHLQIKQAYTRQLRLHPSPPHRRLARPHRVANNFQNRLIDPRVPAISTS